MCVFTLILVSFQNLSNDVDAIFDDWSDEIEGWYFVSWSSLFLFFDDDMLKYNYFSVKLNWHLLLFKIFLMMLMMYLMIDDMKHVVCFFVSSSFLSIFRWCWIGKRWFISKKGFIRFRNLLSLFLFAQTFPMILML